MYSNSNNVSSKKPTQNYAPKPLGSIDEVIDFIEKTYFFFDESFKSASILKWCKEEHPEFERSIKEFHENFVKKLKIAVDVRDKLVENREQHNPESCFIVAVREFHNTDNRGPVQLFLSQNEHLTNFLRVNLPKIGPIILQWYAENYEYIQKIAESSNQTTDNNNNSNNELKTFEKCTAAQFLIENKNFFVFLNSLKSDIAGASSFAIYEDWLKSNEGKSQNEFKNKMILEPFIANLKINFLGSNNENTNKFIELIFTSNRQGLEAFLNENADLDTFLVRNLATLIPLIEKFNGKPYRKLVEDKDVDSAIEVITRNISFIYPMIFFTVFPGCQKGLLSSDEIQALNRQRKLYRNILTRYSNFIQTFKNDFLELIRFVHRQRNTEEQVLIDNFSQAIKDLYQFGVGEVLENVLYGEPLVADFLVENLLKLEGAIQAWNKEQPQNASTSQANAPTVVEAAKTKKTELAIAMTAKAESFLYSMLFFTTFEEQQDELLENEEISALNKSSKLYQAVMVKNLALITKFDENLTNFLGTCAIDRGDNSLTLNFIQAIKNLHKGSDEALKVLLIQEQTLASFLTEYLPMLEQVVEDWNKMLRPANSSQQSQHKETKAEEVVKEVEQPKIAPYLGKSMETYLAGANRDSFSNNNSLPSEIRKPIKQEVVDTDKQSPQGQQVSAMRV